MIDEWDLAATNLHRAGQRTYEVAVLPAAAIEPHNRHLPIGQDWRHTTYVARESCRLAWQRCQKVLCLPTLPYGVDCNLMDFFGAIHVSQATLDAMIREIIASLRAHGLRKVVLINGHGGNDFIPLIRQIQCDLDVFVFLCDWWKVGHDRYKDIFDAPDDHAGEFETSVAMALYGELIEPNVAGDGEARPFAFEALRKCRRRPVGRLGQEGPAVPAARLPADQRVSGGAGPAADRRALPPHGGERGLRHRAETRSSQPFFAYYCNMRKCVCGRGKRAIRARKPIS